MRRYRYGLSATAIIVGAALLSIYWAFLVPIMQSPDEPSHADYVFTIYSAGGLVNAREEPLTPVSTVSHPWMLYLAYQTRLNYIAGHPFRTTPASYGSPAYFSRLDRQAPPLHHPYRPALIPWLLPVKPVAYYALDAAWLGLVSRVTGSLTALYFSARIFSVLLLIISLWGSYYLFVGALGRRLTLVCLAALGYFPLTSFVSSYIQPDNLSLATVVWALVLAERVRRRPAHFPAIAILGCILGLMLVTKYQFYLCIGLPIAAMLLTLRWPQMSWRGAARIAAWLLLPSLLCGAAQVWIHWGARDAILRTGTGDGRPTTQDAAAALSHGPAALLSYGANALGRAVHDFYLGGDAFHTFWGVFGWLDTALIIRSPQVNDIIRAVVTVASVAIEGAVLLSFLILVGRTIRVAQRRGPGFALRLACSHPATNAFFLFSAFMIALDVLTNNSFGAQGRDWFPVLPLIFLVMVRYAPRFLSRARTRDWAQWGIAVPLLLYSIVAGESAVRNVHNRYYCVASMRQIIVGAECPGRSGSPRPPLPDLRP